MISTTQLFISTIAWTFYFAVTIEWCEYERFVFLSIDITHIIHYYITFYHQSQQNFSFLDRKRSFSLEKTRKTAIYWFFIFKITKQTPLTKQETFIGSFLFWLLRLSVRLGIDGIKQRRKLDIPQSQIVCKSTGCHGGNGHQKPHPPVGIQGVAPRMV